MRAVKIPHAGHMCEASARPLQMAALSGQVTETLRGLRSSGARVQIALSPLLADSGSSHVLVALQIIARGARFQVGIKRASNLAGSAVDVGKCPG
jgi:hypothetical protein